MTRNILHIDCSPRQQSHSRELSAAIVGMLLEIAPDASITRRDIGAYPLPHAASDYAMTLSSPAMIAAPIEDSLDLSETLIREIEAADAIVIGTPMHNLTVPSVLKAWIDQVLRAGRTFKSMPTGKVGMVKDRPVFVGIAAGAVFSGERANQQDFLTPYLTAVFGCMGLQSVQFFSLQATAFLDSDKAASARMKALAAIDLTVLAADTRLAAAE